MNGKPLISAAVLALQSLSPSAFSQLSANPFLTDSTSNKFGPFGSPLAEGNL